MKSAAYSRLIGLVRVVATFMLLAAGPFAAPAALPAVAPAIAAGPAAIVQPPCGGALPATADSYANEGAPLGNNGTSTTLQVGKSARGALRTLLAFDLGTRVPAGATIHKAELLLTLSSTPNTNPFRIELHEAGSAWSESTVTWSTQPTLGPGYGQAGYLPTQNAALQNVIRIDVTAAVTRWATGTISNTGLVLLPVDDGITLSFDSRESTRAAGVAPQLQIACTLTEPSGAGDQTQDDQRQLAGIARLKQRSSQPATLRLRQGALNFADLMLTLPDSVGRDPLVKAQWFLRAYSDTLRLRNPDQELQLARRSSDGNHLFFRQRHNGIPVFPATLGIHLDGRNVRGVGGSYVPEITTPATPRLSARQAESIAAALFGDGSVRPGESPSRLANGSPRPIIKGVTQLRYLNLGLLGHDDHTTYLTWRVNVAGPSGPFAIFVDAFSGQVRFKQSQVTEDLDLDIETGNHDSSISCWILTTSDDQWFDQNGVVSGASPDSEGYGTFNNIKAVYNYWKNRFGHDSYDDDGEDIEMYIHVGQSWKNAHYNSSCDIFEFGDGYPKLDVVAHEFTHGVTHSFADLVYENQSGALNESFSDIFGYFVDSNDPWMGDELSASVVSSPNSCKGAPAGTLRDMSNPPNCGDPDHMLAAKSGDGKGLRKLAAGKDAECDSSDPNYNDCGYVHTNSGINNKAAYLVINGGTGGSYTVQGIGKTKAERLFYNVLTYRLWDSAQLIDARNAAVAEASWQYALGKFTKNDICQVKDAYAAVGLGSGDIDCDGVEDNVDTDKDGDGVPDTSDNCVSNANPGQSDIDGDGQGDACDTDIDGDGIANQSDNCKLVSNASQADWNNDGQGDKCDDSDQDGVKDSVDNCRSVANPDQQNTDGDFQGDACDNDKDNDGVQNAADNCQLTYNPDQKDSDGDGIGDACDHCPTLSSSDNGDPDNDGLGNPCDADDDNDGIPDGQDICPFEPGYGCLKVGTIYDIDVILSKFSRFPIPNCIMCGSEYIPAGLEVTVNLNVPVGFEARILDANGQTVAKGKALVGGKLSLKFKPAAFAGPHTGAAALGALDPSATPSGDPAPDEERYTLEVGPADGVNGTGPTRLTVSVSEGIPSTTYLALVGR